MPCPECSFSQRPTSCRRRRGERWCSDRSALSFLFVVAAAIPFKTFAQRIDTLPPTRVVLTNTAQVPYYWVVYELELYFDHCRVKRPVPVFSPQQIVDSGFRRDFPEATGYKAFDGSTLTNWTSDCIPGEIGGGCQPYQAYIGLDLTATQEFANAFHPNATLDDKEAIKIKCVKFLQSSHPLYKADSIAVEMWVPGGPSSGYWRDNVFDITDASGGAWAWRPAPEDSLWRIRNADTILGRWGVAELRFYSDFFCTHEVRGAYLSSSTWKKPINAEAFIMDDNVSTAWVAGCDTWTTSSTKGCDPLEGWIGMDFGVKETVRCLKMAQKQYDPLALIAEMPSFTRAFRLEKFDGSKWDDVETFISSDTSNFNLSSVGKSTLQSPYFGKSPDTYKVQTDPGRDAMNLWEDTRPPDNTAWRLGNDDWTQDTWKVYEVEFYNAVDCKGRPKLLVNLDNPHPKNFEGDPISVQGPKHRDEALRLFDNQAVLDNGWESDCRGHQAATSRTACSPMEGWFGLYFRNLYPIVHCFKILQSQHHVHTASGVELSRWFNGSWQTYTRQRDIGGGGWNRRPSPPWSMWRVFNAEPVVAQWKMLEIKAFRDPMCLMELYHGQSDRWLDGDGWTPIGSGFRYVRENFPNAFDGYSLTNWGADCLQCTEPYGYWIGASLPNGTEDAYAGRFVVRCIKAWQSPIYEEQAQRLRVDVWNGEDWVISPLTGNGEIGGFGGGIWVRSPAAYASKWRLVSADANRMYWRFSEVEFFSDSRCEQRLRRSSTNSSGKDERLGGAHYLVSGYRTELDAIAYESVVGERREFSDAVFGVDQDGISSVLLDHRPSEDLPAWFAMDFLSEVAWVRCVKFKQGPLAPEQSKSVKLEWWDGFNWTSNHPEISMIETEFHELGGAGWNRRPAADGTMWRLENMEPVPEGWAVYEIEFHNDVLCKSAAEDPWRNALNASKHGLVGDPIASGYVPSEANNGPQVAFDGDALTAWLSQCSQIRRGNYAEYLPPPETGCDPREAWIGLDFGNDVYDVVCVRIKHPGYGNVQSENVAVSKWNGERWEQVWELYGLGGSTWDQRPAGPNTMWRAVYREDLVRKCRGERLRVFPRLWGLTEFQLFTDDTCTNKIEGGRPVRSGDLETFRRTAVDPPNYNVENAMDGDIETTWAANCRIGWKNNRREGVNCIGQFFGVDYGERAVEVRCMRLMQARFASSICCDTPEAISLERWNGTKWVEASWLHVPPEGFHDRERFRQLGAYFRKMGKCQPDSATTPPWEAKVWEQRFRRESDNCMIPLPGSTVLLGDPPCIEHSMCVDAVGGDGQCCPIGDSLALTKENRCCCGFLQGEAIFFDEAPDYDARKAFAIEHVTIVLARYCPYVGLGLSIALWFLAMTMPSDAQPRFADWVQSEHAPCPCTPRVRRFLHVLCWPALEWRTFIAYNPWTPAQFCRWFLFPKGRKPQIKTVYRVFLWIGFGMFCSGVGVWVGLAVFFGQIMLWALFKLALPIKWSRSPYDPQDERDMALREKVTDEILKAEDDTATAKDVTRDVVATIIAGTVYFLKFIFDLLVCRAQLISYGGVPPIDAKRVVDIFPGLIRMLQEPAALMYSAMVVASEIISKVLSNTIGIPQCHGTCVLYASCALITVLYTVCKWQNCDFFGLFAASRQALKFTRPECQRTFGIGAVLGGLSITFGTIQASMVLFSRSMAMANPFKKSVWMCEEDDSPALYMGYFLILLSSMVGCGTFFLSVNGHFLGQDYLTEPLGEFLSLDFAELDPDGTGDDGGFIRCNVWGAAVPTIFGLWFDSWNVKAFLIKERGQVYSKQLRDPQICLHCGTVHVKYQLLFVACGRQVSLALQMLPYGTLVGKACEYINDPPIYCGRVLPCASVAKGASEPRPVLHKSMILAKLALLIAEMCSLGIDYVLPLGKRVVAFFLYYYIVQGVFAINEDNLVDLGRHIIFMGFMLGIAKASAEFFAESLLSWTMGCMFNIAMAIEGTVDRKKDVKRTVLGQVMFGAVCSSQIAVLLPFAGWTGMHGAFFLAIPMGYALGLASLFVAWRMEAPLVEVVRAPRGIVYTMIKCGFCLLVGGMFWLMAWQTLKFQGTLAVGVMFAGYLLAIMKLVYIERRAKPPGEEGAIISDEMQLRASPAYNTLFSSRVLSGTIAAVGGAFIGLTVCGEYNAGVGRTANECAVAALLALHFGLVIGIIGAMTIDGLIAKGKYSQLVSIGVTCVVIWPVSMWNGLVAIFSGVFLGALFGSLFEWWLVSNIWAEDSDKRAREDEEARLKAIRDATVPPPLPERGECLALAMDRLDDKKHQLEEGLAEARRRLKGMFATAEHALKAMDTDVDQQVTRAEFIVFLERHNFSRFAGINLFNQIDVKKEGLFGHDELKRWWMETPRALMDQPYSKQGLELADTSKPLEAELYEAVKNVERDRASDDAPADKLETTLRMSAGPKGTEQRPEELQALVPVNGVDAPRAPSSPAQTDFSNTQQPLSAVKQNGQTSIVLALEDNCNFERDDFVALPSPDKHASQGNHVVAIHKGGSRRNSPHGSARQSRRSSPGRSRSMGGSIKALPAPETEQPWSPMDANAEDLPDDDLFGRWDRTTPHAGALPAGHRSKSQGAEPRKSFRPKPSLLKHRDKPMPPAPTLARLHKATVRGPSARDSGASRAGSRVQGGNREASNSQGGDMVLSNSQGGSMGNSSSQMGPSDSHRGDTAPSNLQGRGARPSPLSLTQ